MFSFYFSSFEITHQITLHRSIFLVLIICILLLDGWLLLNVMLTSLYVWTIDLLPSQSCSHLWHSACRWLIIYNLTHCRIVMGILYIWRRYGDRCQHWMIALRNCMLGAHFLLLKLLSLMFLYLLLFIYVRKGTIPIKSIGHSFYSLINRLVHRLKMELLTRVLGQMKMYLLSMKLIVLLLMHFYVSVIYC